MNPKPPPTGFFRLIRLRDEELQAPANSRGDLLHA
jgi:hypothetical protein